MTEAADDDLAQRLTFHTYITARRGPGKVVFEEFPSRPEAVGREMQIKSSKSHRLICISRRIQTFESRPRQR